MSKALKLEEQTFAYRENPDQVIAVQHWSGFLRGLHGLVVSVNGQVRQQRAGRPCKVRDWYRLATSLDLPVLNEDQARVHVRRITGTPDRHCGCSALLPLGGLWCTECGESQHRQPAVMAASAS